MPRGDNSKITEQQKRQARHIEADDRERGGCESIWLVVPSAVGRLRRRSNLTNSNLTNRAGGPARQWLRIGRNESGKLDCPQHERPHWSMMPVAGSAAPFPVH